MRKVLLFIVVALAALAAVAPASATNEMITICHAAGQAGTTKYVTLTLPTQAVYGQAGHFNENGTPRAGHEEDYLGPCAEEEEDLDVCTNIDGLQTEVPEGMILKDGVCVTPTPPPTPSGDRCDPGEGPYRGKDGEPGNQECCPDANNDQKCDEAAPLSDPVTPQPPVEEPPPVTPPVTPPAGEEPEVEKPEKPEKPQPVKPEAVKPPKAQTPEEPKTSSTTDEGTLPYTGLPVLPIAALGAGLVGLGAWLRRRYPS